MRRMQELLTRFENLQKGLEKEQDRKRNLLEQKEGIENTLERLDNEATSNIMKKELLEQASERAREDGMRVLSETASNAVQAVLGEGTSVDMVSTIRNGVPNVDVLVKRTKNGVEVTTDPTQGEGGGVADIVAMSMFFSLGLLVGNDNRAPIFMDEPTKFLSKGFSSEAASFIYEMVEYTNKQTFLVTHDEEIALSGDKIFKVELDEQLVSQVSEIE